MKLERSIGELKPNSSNADERIATQECSTVVTDAGIVIVFRFEFVVLKLFTPDSCF
jgi:hypothetical protein